MKSIENIETIEHYLLDKMDKSAKTAFENEMLVNDSLKDKVEQVRISLDAVKDQGLRNEFKQIHRKIETRSKQSRQRKLYFTGIAASVAIVIISLITTFNNSNDQIFDKYFYLYPNLITKRGDQDDALLKISQAYSDQHFYRADSIYCTIQNETNSDQVLLYAALAKIKIEKYAEAIQLLASINSLEYYQQATWYKALIYIKIDNYPLASQELKNIKPEDFKFEEAQELLDIIQ